MAAAFAFSWDSGGSGYVTGDMCTHLIKRLLTAAGNVAAAAMVFAPLDICAQTVSKPMAFDVASIRRNVDNIGTCSLRRTDFT